MIEPEQKREPDHRPHRLLILGSCVSRDALAFAPAEFELVDYFARCSLASLACAPLDKPVAVAKLQSPFQKRMVQRDMSKKFLSAVKALSFDLLLLDLIDERFSVYVGPDGGCTISSELHRCEPRIAKWPGQVLKPGTPAFMVQWEHGWETLLAALRDCDAVRKVRVNAVLWSKRRRSGGALLPHHNSAQIDAANVMLEAMYSRLRRDLTEDQFLHFPEELLLSADDHKWGPSPYHYIDEYYSELMRRLCGTAVAETPAGSSQPVDRRHASM